MTVKKRGRLNMDIKQLLGDMYEEGMTAEEMIEALGSVGAVPGTVPSTEHAKVKAAFDKAASETAAMKRKLRALEAQQSAEPAVDAAATAKLLDMEGQLAEQTKLIESLQREKAVADGTSRFQGLGYDAALAAAAAVALIEGDTATLFDIQGRHQKSMESRLKKESAANLTAPPTGATGGAAPPKTLEMMTVSEQMALASSDPEAYAALCKPKA